MERVWGFFSCLLFAKMKTDVHTLLKAGADRGISAQTMVLPTERAGGGAFHVSTSRKLAYSFPSVLSLGRFVSKLFNWNIQFIKLQQDYVSLGNLRN